MIYKKKKEKLSWSKIANVEVNHKFPEEMHIFKQTVLPYIYATLFRFSSSPLLLQVFLR